MDPRSPEDDEKGAPSPAEDAARDLPRLLLIGTGHVFDLRTRVQDEIRRFGPTVVALELDPARYHALRSGDRDTSGAPLFYRVLAGFQDRVAKAYGVEAGDEMLAAAEEAQRLQVPVALIDLNAGEAFQRIWSEMGILERLRFLGSTVLGAFLPSKDVEEQVTELQENYAAFFSVLGEKYPTLKRVLLDDRNAHMAANLREILRGNPRVVAVVGDGHVDGILELLADADVRVEARRLKELRAAVAAEGSPDDGPGSEDGPSENASASVSFTVEY